MNTLESPVKPEILVDSEKLSQCEPDSNTLDVSQQIDYVDENEYGDSKYQSSYNKSKFEKENKKRSKNKANKRRSSCQVKGTKGNKKSGL